MGYRLNPGWGSSSAREDLCRYRERTSIILAGEPDELERKVDKLVTESTELIERVQRENIEKAIRMARLPKDQIIEIGLLTQTTLGE
jgi:hypothetical protein